MRYIYEIGKQLPKNIPAKITCLFALLMCLYAVQEVSAQAVEPVVTATANIQPLQIGDHIPEELWHMPLQVVNHPDGKDTITLNDYRGKLIILDFWASYCSPCIRSIAKISSILEERDLVDEIVLIPVLVHDTPERGEKFLKNWNSSIWSVNDGAFHLKSFFSNYISGFGAVLISDGKFVAAPSAKDISYEKLKHQAERQAVEWINVSWKGVQP